MSRLISYCFNHFKGISPLIKLLMFSILIKIVVYLTVCLFYLVIELLGVKIIGVFLPKELLGLIRLLVCLSLLLKEIIIVPFVFRAMKFGSVFSIFGVICSLGSSLNWNLDQVQFQSHNQRTNHGLDLNKIKDKV